MSWNRVQPTFGFRLGSASTRSEAGGSTILFWFSSSIVILQHPPNRDPIHPNLHDLISLVSPRKVEDMPSFKSYLASRGNQISGAVFLIGLGICFLTNHLFPGVLYALAVSLIVPRPSDQTDPGWAWNRFTAASVLAAIGLMFDLRLEGTSLVGVVLVCIGVFSLFGALAMRSNDHDTTESQADDPATRSPHSNKRRNESKWNGDAVGVDRLSGQASAKPYVDRDLS